jgi:SpoVK/Ycf46/Vps4 family AAA+-type ATPase
MFQLTAEEIEASRSQIATLKPARGKNLKYPPLAFTEHGAIMAASVLSSPGAVAMSVYVVRAFARLRETLAWNQELAKRLDQLEATTQRKLATRDKSIAAIISAIRELMAHPPVKRRGIGFTADLAAKT